MAGSVPTTRRDVHPQRTFRAFENRGYVCLWLANCLLYTARWMRMTLLAWLILDLTDSPWLVALVGFFSSAPMFLLGRVGGILADRVHRQRLPLLMGATASAVHPVFAIRMHALLGIVCLAFIMVLIPSFTERTQPVRIAPIPQQARR